MTTERTTSLGGAAMEWLNGDEQLQDENSMLGGDEPKANAQKHPTPARDEGERLCEKLEVMTLHGYSEAENVALRQAAKTIRDLDARLAALSPDQTGGTAELAEYQRIVSEQDLTDPYWEGYRDALALVDNLGLAAPVAEGAREAIRAGLRAGYHHAQSPDSYSASETAFVFNQIEAAEKALQALDTGTNRGGVGD